MKYIVLVKIDTKECLVFYGYNPTDIVYHYLVWEKHEFETQAEAEEYISVNDLSVIEDTNNETD